MNLNPLASQNRWSWCIKGCLWSFFGGNPLRFDKIAKETMQNFEWLTWQSITRECIMCRCWAESGLAWQAPWPIGDLIYSKFGQLRSHVLSDVHHTVTARSHVTFRGSILQRIKSDPDSFVGWGILSRIVWFFDLIHCQMVHLAPDSFHNQNFFFGWILLCVSFSWTHS